MHQRNHLRHFYARCLAQPARYGFALLMVALALLLTLWLRPLHQTPFPLFFAAVVVIASRTGRGPGLVAILLSSVVLDFFFFFPDRVHSLSLGLATTVQLCVFVLVALWINSVYADRRNVDEELQKQTVKLHRSEQELSDFFDNAVIGLHWVGPDGIILRANRADMDLLGCSPEEFIGRHIAEFHADQGAIDDILRRLQVGEVLQNFEARLRCKDGSIKTVLIDSNVLRENGAFIHTRCFTRDISDRKRIEEELRRAHNELESRVEQRTAELSQANERLRCEIAVRQQAEAAIRESEARFRSFAHAATDAIISADKAGNIISWNQGVESIFGHAEEEVLGKPLTIIIPEHYQEAHRRGLDRLQRTGECRVIGKTVELDGRRKDGSEFPLELSLAAWKVGDAQFYGGIIRETTQRKHLEEQYRQSQKMEAIGSLAGGVAHDFNNLLTIITGYGEIARSRLNGHDELRDMIDQMVTAAHRAASLTRQLLAFSRRQILESKVLDLNALVAETEKMLRRVIGEDIELHTSLLPTLGRVKADPGEIGQVIMNLAVNARDAMPEGGTLTIETDNLNLEGGLADKRSQVPPGQYVAVTVSDTGCGMDQATQERIFEPFFTTKEQGKGTGLGLATVYGIVRQSGGHIRVDSKPGRGTTFTIIPAVDRR